MAEGGRGLAARCCTGFNGPALTQRHRVARHHSTRAGCGWRDQKSKEAGGLQQLAFRPGLAVSDRTVGGRGCTEASPRSPRKLQRSGRSVGVNYGRLSRPQLKLATCSRHDTRIVKGLGCRLTC